MSVPSVDLPLVMSSAGASPTPIATLDSQQTAAAAALAPAGYTNRLPASLLSDVAGTQLAGLSLLDQMRVDLVNDVTPLGANAFLLIELGQLLGIPLGQATNGSVDVVFSGSAGYVVQDGFIVSDGTNQYVVQGGTVIGSGGTSAPTTAVATNPDTFAIPAATVTQLVSSVASGYILSVTNPLAGTPAGQPESFTAYRARVVEAMLASSQGMARYARTLIRAVSGVVANQVAIQQQSGGGWKIIAGGGDDYAVAYAILSSVFDIPSLVGSTIAISNITRSLAPPAAPTLTAATSGGTLVTGTYYFRVTYTAAYGETDASSLASVSVTGPTGQVTVTSPSAQTIDGVPATGYNVYAYLASGTMALQNSTPVAIGTDFVMDAYLTGTATTPAGNTTGLYTTDINHLYATGDSVTVTGASPTGFNGTNTVTVFSEKVFSTGVDTSGLSAWSSGGVCTPNSRNVSASLFDDPDTYTVEFVRPPQQSVTVVVTWNTGLSNFTQSAAVAQATAPAIVAYLNALAVGAPINQLDMSDAFRAAAAPIIAPENIIKLAFAVDINGISTSPTSGEQIIPGDPESYFYASASAVTVNQG